jgi:hypothetical protein
MTISYQLVTLQVLATTLHNTIALNTATNPKAASTYVNCDCQCSSLTFQDKFGRTQGNCKTADNTGATWCYVDSRSPCLDKQRSVRFSQSGHAWSYQACSTPPRHSAQCSSGFGSGNYQQGVICKGSGCSPVGGSYPTSSGQFGSGGYGTSSSYGTSGSYQTGSIANCRHGQNCNVGSSGSYGSSSGSYGSSSGSSGSYGSSSGSIANCRYGQNCNVGYNTGSSSGSFNNGGFGSSGQQYNPYGSNGQQVSLGSILQGRKTKEGSVNFS